MNKIFRDTLRVPTIILFLVFLANHAQAAGEIIIDKFDLSPKTVTNNTIGTQFQMTFRVTVDLNKFNSRCGSNEDSFYWYVYQDVPGFDFKRASGEQKFNRTSTSVSVNFDQPITIDTSDPDLTLGGKATYYGQVNCPSVRSIQISRSVGVPITFGSITDKNYACVAADNKYACSPANLSNLSDVPACSGRTPIQIGKNLCGKDAGSGPGSGVCNSDGKCDVGETAVLCPKDNCQPATPGKTQTFLFKLDNPLQANNLIELIDVLATWLFNLAIPVVVIMIVYAGVMFLTSRGDTGQVTKARQILLYAVVGFAIILIGKGFITLIESILNLGANP